MMKRHRQHTTQRDIIQDNCLDSPKKVVIKKQGAGCGSRENCLGLKEMNRQ